MSADMRKVEDAARLAMADFDTPSEPELPPGPPLLWLLAAAGGVLGGLVLIAVVLI